MPYYIYRITEQPIRRLEKITEREAFRDASAEAKRLRAEAGGGSAGTTIKMILADNELQAEDLLSQVREAPPVYGDDY